MRNYQDLRPFCRTERQIEIIELLIQTPSLSAVARDQQIAKQSVADIVNTIQRYAEKRGQLGDMKEKGIVPEDFYAETSVKRRRNPETGLMEVIEDWTKSRLNKQMQAEAYRHFIEGLSADIIPVQPTKPIPPNPNLLASAIIFGDAHLGMMAHAVETMGEDHNLETAVADIIRAIDYFVAVSPNSEEGWLINVGDFMHSTDSRHVTQASEANLDMSARHNQVLKAAGRLLRYCIDRMLTKFNKVLVVNARGNHDEDAAFALNMYLQGVYENEPRVDIPGNDSRFFFKEFGKNLIGVNHGDKMNQQRLADVMTRNASEAWGRTKYRTWLIGHIHHKQKVGIDSGVTIESFNTLAPVDYWHASSGYKADQNVSMITYHREFGEVNRMTPHLEMLRAFNPVKEPTDERVTT